MQQHGFRARRTQQYCGNTGDASDVTCNELSPDWFIEVKHVEKLNLYEALEKAFNEAGLVSKKAFIAHRKNRTDWFITLRADDFLKLLKPETVEAS